MFTPMLNPLRERTIVEEQSVAILNDHCNRENAFGEVEDFMGMLACLRDIKLLGNTIRFSLLRAVSLF